MARKAPEDGRQEMVSVRFPEKLLAEMDAWITAQPGYLTRSQAIRWMVEQYLKTMKRRS